MIFALGVRLLAGPGDTVGADGTGVPPGRRVEPASRLDPLRARAYGVLVGMLVIVGGGMGKIVELARLLPTLVPKPH